MKRTDGISNVSDLQIIPLSEEEPHLISGDWRRRVAAIPPFGVEGYKMLVLEDDSKVLIIANGQRASPYGVGKLLRSMEISTKKVLVPRQLSISTTPSHPIRCHQLGYRSKTNSYDAWSAAQFDQYICELAIFGANKLTHAEHTLMV
ncbi:MAG: hypothetical protein HKN87_19485 [Saprospiraceae bacterium]|nr:hypothetical protein [Saprospiraceae bacterium]